MACLLLQHKHRTRLPTCYYELWQVRCIILGIKLGMAKSSTDIGYQLDTALILKYRLGIVVDITC